MNPTQHPADPKGAAGAKKCPLHLLAPHALRETAWVAKHGADKYGPYNWREAHVNATTYVGAIMRHLMAWSEGEDIDPESGRSHIAHIAASAFILIDAQQLGTLIDDRAKVDLAGLPKAPDAVPDDCTEIPADTFECAGFAWTPHTPGDPCPVADDTKVRVLLRGELDEGEYRDVVQCALDFDWGRGAETVLDIVAWAYAE